MTIEETKLHEPHDAEHARRKGFYLLPNFFTTAGLFAGFYAIVATMKGLFDYASVAIFIAMLMDSLDGRVARLTNTQSAFGAEYDSLSDLVAFGIAPALLAYNWASFHLGKLGWLAAFLYVAATALRLARFNTRTQDVPEDKRYFQGLPCTAAAGFLTISIWIQVIYHFKGRGTELFITIIAVLLALLMVSNVPYRSFKDKDFKDRVPFLFILLILFIFVAIALDPPKTLGVIFTGYILSGFVSWLLEWRRSRKQTTL